MKTIQPDEGGFIGQGNQGIGQSGGVWLIMLIKTSLVICQKLYKFSMLRVIPSRPVTNQHDMPMPMPVKTNAMALRLALRH